MHEGRHGLGMGLLSGLKGLGLGNLEDMDIFEEEKKEEPAKKQSTTITTVSEKDLIYDKSVECPVCGTHFTTKIMKTGKARLVGMDQDLRARYEGIDTGKYDVSMCPVCGYAALGRYFSMVTAAQAKLIKEKISMTVSIKEYHDETYGYEQAFERYQLALACAVVKHSKASEKAYICLKSGWLLRGWRESLENGDTGEQNLTAKLIRQEDEYLENAWKGFLEARKTEHFPMCGMDSDTVDYLLAALAIHLKKYEAASKLVSVILTSTTANNRIKDKARDLKAQILVELKNPSR